MRIGTQLPGRFYASWHVGGWTLVLLPFLFFTWLMVVGGWLIVRYTVLAVVWLGIGCYRAGTWAAAKTRHPAHP